MGGGCICKNIEEKNILNSSEEQSKIIPLENGQNIIKNNDYNKIANKTSNILYNIMENNQDSKIYNKRYSDFQTLEKKQIEKSSNLKNITNKVSNLEGINTSYNEASFMVQKNANNNDENTKIIRSINNSSYFNGSNIISKQKGNEKIEEENNNSNNKNKYENPNNKHNIVINKIKKKRRRL